MNNFFRQIKIRQNFRLFFYLFLIVSIRYLKNIFGVFFGIVFPIIWLIVSYFIWGKTANPKYFVEIFTAFSLLPSASLGLVSFPMNFGSDRIMNLNKIYSTLNVSQSKYFFVNYVVIFLQFLITTNIILLVGNFLFIGDVFHSNNDLISANEYFAVLFINIYAFTICFIFSLGISQIGKTIGHLFSFIIAYYYLNLFISGIIVPVYEYDPTAFSHPQDNWFKWLQYITPIGSSSRLIQNVVIPNCWTWNTDWLCFFSPVLQASLIFFLVYKFSFWRYHYAKNSR